MKVNKNLIRNLVRKSIVSEIQLLNEIAADPTVSKFDIGSSGAQLTRSFAKAGQGTNNNHQDLGNNTGAMVMAWITLRDMVDNIEQNGSSEDKKLLADVGLNSSRAPFNTTQNKKNANLFYDKWGSTFTNDREDELPDVIKNHNNVLSLAGTAYQYGRGALSGNASAGSHIKRSLWFDFTDYLYPHEITELVEDQVYELFKQTGLFKLAGEKISSSVFNKYRLWTMDGIRSWVKEKKPDLLAAAAEEEEAATAAAEEEAAEAPEAVASRVKSYNLDGDDNRLFKKVVNAMNSLTGGKVNPDKVKEGDAAELEKFKKLKVKFFKKMTSFAKFNEIFPDVAKSIAAEADTGLKVSDIIKMIDEKEVTFIQDSADDPNIAAATIEESFVFTEDMIRLLVKESLLEKMLNEQEDTPGGDPPEDDDDSKKKRKRRRIRKRRDEKELARTSKGDLPPVGAGLERVSAAEEPFELAAEEPFELKPGKISPVAPDEAVLSDEEADAMIDTSSPTGELSFSDNPERARRFIDKLTKLPKEEMIAKVKKLSPEQAEELQGKLEADGLENMNQEENDLYSELGNVVVGVDPQTGMQSTPTTIAYSSNNSIRSFLALLIDISNNNFEYGSDPTWRTGGGQAAEREATGRAGGTTRTGQGLQRGGATGRSPRRSNVRTWEDISIRVVDIPGIEALEEIDGFTAGVTEAVRKMVTRRFKSRRVAGGNISVTIRPGKRRLVRLATGQLRGIFGAGASGVEAFQRNLQKMLKAYGADDVVTERKTFEIAINIPAGIYDRDT